MLWHCASKNGRCSETPREFHVGHFLEFITGEDLGGIQTRLLSDGAGGLRIIAGYHDDPDASRAAFLDRRRDAWTEGIGKPGQTEKLEREATRCLWASIIGWDSCFGDSENPDALAAHFIDRSVKLAAIVLGQTAKLGYGLRRALSGNKKVAADPVLPYVCHGQKIRGKAVFPFGYETMVRLIGGDQNLFTESVERLFHRIERLTRA